MKSILSLACLLSVSNASLADPDSSAEPWWPQFRGPNASGLGKGQPVVRWDVSNKDNVLWMRAIPGLAHSCPVVWGDKLWVTTAIGKNTNPELRLGLYGDIESVKDEDGLEQDWTVVCLNRRTGEPLWQKSILKAIPGARRHPKSTHANSTPATDGKHLVCVLNETLYCLDAAKGTQIWAAPLGKLGAGYYKAPADTWGFASSPILHGNKVLLQCDVQTQSWIAAFSLTDGATVWKTDRKDKPTWSTPSVYTHAGKTAVVVNGYEKIAGYDLENGQEIWWMRGGGDIPVPAPVVAKDTIVITNAHGRLSPVMVLRTTADGDISAADRDGKNPFIRWLSDRYGNYMQTPLVADHWLFLCNDGGIASCLDLATGDHHWRERLADGKTGFTASPVAAGGHIYFTGEDGSIRVVRMASKFELQATNPLGEPTMASPAVAEGVLYFRTKSQMIAIGAK